ncbi:MAG: ComEC/Rec2 family competence protein [Holosporales bacterium]|jgi:ComEC/Rec2-related protein|nr:ComEC/Rec2 family competence protein [Holosporales bacterium]
MPLLVDKTYITEQIEKTSFYADVGFIEETHPTMKNMQRLILKNIRFCESKDSENYDSVNTVKMTCGTRMLRGIQPLDAVKVVGSLLPLKGPVIPGSFDPKQYNSIMGIDATGVVFYLRKLSSNTKHSNFTEIFSYLRFHLTKAISGRLHGEASGVVSALLTGDKSSISSETRDKFIKSGTAHVLAISGLHMSIVTFIIFSIIKRLLMYVCCIIGRTIGFRAIAAFITIPFTFVYLALSGFSPSATRAFIMTSICMISIMIGRRAMSIRNISTAALLILVLDPGALFHVSFQLSFSAVLALLAFYEKYNSLLPYRPSVSWKILSYILSSMIMTTIATIATTPISVATFNRFSAQNLFGNLIAVPIVSFLIAPLGIANIVICKFTNILIKPLQLSIDAMIRAMGVISSLPGSEIALKTPAQYIMWFIIIGGILLCFLISKLRYIGGGFIGAGFFCYIFVQKSPYLIVVPNDDGIVCMIENGTVYANSNQKGRPKIYSIMRTLGLKEEPNGNNSKGNNSKGNNSKGNNIVKRDLISGLKLFTNQSIIRELKTKNFSNEEGFFLWRDGKVRHIKQRKHPYCPAFYYAKALE